MNKTEIKKILEIGFGYDLSRPYSLIQPYYGFNESCQESVPEAIIAFLSSDSYEDTIRRCIALGGDADTQAAIAGGIAAAYYKEIPDIILKECIDRLPGEMRDVMERFSNELQRRHG